MIDFAKPPHNPCGEIVLGVMAVCMLRERRLRHYLRLVFKYRAYRKRLRWISNLLTVACVTWCVAKICALWPDLSWGYFGLVYVGFVIVQLWLAHLEIKTHRAEINVINRAAR